MQSLCPCGKGTWRPYMGRNDGAMCSPEPKALTLRFHPCAVIGGTTRSVYQSCNSAF